MSAFVRVASNSPATAATVKGIRFRLAPDLQRLEQCELRASMATIQVLPRPLGESRNEGV